MRRPANPHPLLLAVLTVAALSACNEGPRIEARPQTITFAAAPSPVVNQSTATVSASASSGLTVRYSSRTPLLCSVVPESGVVTATTSGICTVAASQAGNATYAAAFPATQDVAFRFRGVITFDPAPSLAVYDLGTVHAVESTGLPVGYGSATPVSCSVEAATGLVAALAAGDCTIVASEGDAQASQTFAISAPSAPAPPGAPSGVTATAGDAQATVSVRVGGVQAGGSPITGYAVTSTPPGVTATSATQPVTATCPSSCAGYRFSIAATNGLGPGPASGPADVVTGYDVVVVFHEPDTQPNDSIFLGTYTFDASTGAVSGLRGRLSESMTGGASPYPDDTMTWIDVGNQLSAIPVTLDGADGWLVTSFRLGVTDTLSANPRFGGTDGWEPGTGSALHWGFPGPNPGNSYVRIFVKAAEPATAPTAGQLARIAYADCAPGGMMGEMCMTGTSVAGYGRIGSMGGFPLSQVTTRR